MPVLEHTILMLPEFPAFANTMRESQQARGCDAKAGRPKVEAEVCHMWRGKKRRYVCHVGGIILSKNPPWRSYINVIAHLGPCAPSGSFCMMSMSLSVQSPAERMWTLKKSSSGAEVMVNGCHSSCEMAGQLRKTYWPTSILKPFFCSCSSSTFDGRITIWILKRREGKSAWEKKPAGQLRERKRSHESNVPSCSGLSARSGWSAADARKGTEPSDRSPTSRSEQRKHAMRLLIKLWRKLDWFQLLKIKRNKKRRTCGNPPANWGTGHWGIRPQSWMRSLQKVKLCGGSVVVWLLTMRLQTRQTSETFTATTTTALH